jgi:hypothetical protein
MTQTITIKVYPLDYGYGRIIARYDSGNPADELEKESFDQVEHALTWAGRMAKRTSEQLRVKDEIRVINRQTEDIQKIVNFIGGEQG